MRTSVATLALLACLPTAAAALAIEFGGTVQLAPGAQFDSSVFDGMSVTGRYEVDPTPSGGPPGEVGAARLTFAFGNYEFDVTQSSHVISWINDRVAGLATVDIWQSGQFSVDQFDPLIPQHPDGVGFAARVQLFDFDSSILDGSEPANFVVSDLSEWESTSVFLSERIASDTGVLENVKLEIALDTWQVVPEPHSGALLAIGLLSLVRRRGREHVGEPERAAYPATR